MKVLASANPESFAVQMQLGSQAGGERRYRWRDRVGGACGARCCHWPATTTIPHRFIAAVAMKAKDTPRAIRALEDTLKIDHSDVESARQLVSLVEPLGDAARTEAAYRRVVDVDPFDGKAQAGLGRLALQRKDTTDRRARVPERRWRRILPIVPTAHTDLAEALVAAGQLKDAKTETLNALEIAPSYDRALDLLLKINESN